MTTLDWLLLTAGGWMLYSAVLNRSPLGSLDNVLHGKTNAAQSVPQLSLGGGFPGSQTTGPNPPGNAGEGKVPSGGQGPELYA